MSKHKHYDLIIEWCRNPQKYTVLFKNPANNSWEVVGQPSWSNNLQYQLVPKVQAEHTEFSELRHNVFFTFVDESAKIALGRCRKIIVPSECFGNLRANRDDRSMFMDESGCIHKCHSQAQVELWKE